MAERHTSAASLQVFLSKCHSREARDGLVMPVCCSDHLHLVSWQDRLLTARLEDLQAVCVAQGALIPPANAFQDRRSC